MNMYGQRRAAMGFRQGMGRGGQGAEYSSAGAGFSGNPLARSSGMWDGNRFNMLHAAIRNRSEALLESRLARQERQANADRAFNFQTSEADRAQSNADLDRTLREASQTAAQENADRAYRLEQEKLGIGQQNALAKEQARQAIQQERIATAAARKRQELLDSGRLPGATPEEQSANADQWLKENPRLWQPVPTAGMGMGMGAGIGQEYDGGYDGTAASTTEDTSYSLPAALIGGAATSVPAASVRPSPEPPIVPTAADREMMTKRAALRHQQFYGTAPGGAGPTGVVPILPPAQGMMSDGSDPRFNPGRQQAVMDQRAEAERAAVSAASVAEQRQGKQAAMGMGPVQRAVTAPTVATAPVPQIDPALQAEMEAAKAKMAQMGAVREVMSTPAAPDTAGWLAKSRAESDALRLPTLAEKAAADPGFQAYRQQQQNEFNRDAQAQGKALIGGAQKAFSAVREAIAPAEKVAVTQVPFSPAVPTEKPAPVQLKPAKAEATPSLELVKANIEAELEDRGIVSPTHRDAQGPNAINPQERFNAEDVATEVHRQMTMGKSKEEAIAAATARYKLPVLNTEAQMEAALSVSPLGIKVSPRHKLPEGYEIKNGMAVRTAAKEKADAELRKANAEAKANAVLQQKWAAAEAQSDAKNIRDARAFIGMNPDQQALEYEMVKQRRGKRAQEKRIKDSYAEAARKSTVRIGSMPTFQ